MKMIYTSRTHCQVVGTGAGEGAYEFNAKTKEKRSVV